MTHVAFVAGVAGVAVVASVAGVADVVVVAVVASSVGVSFEAVSTRTLVLHFDDAIITINFIINLTYNIIIDIADNTFNILIFPSKFIHFFTPSSLLICSHVVFIAIIIVIITVIIILLFFFLLIVIFITTLFTSLQPIFDGVQPRTSFFFQTAPNLQ